RSVFISDYDSLLAERLVRTSTCRPIAERPVGSRHRMTVSGWSPAPGKSRNLGDGCRRLGTYGGAVTSGARLQLKLLGGFEARLQPRAAPVLPTRQPQASLAYLAVPLGQSHPREKLATLLWGDMPHAQARSNLRNALSRIKKVLPKAVRASLVVDGASVSLDPSAVDVDVARLERLLADGSM